MTLTSPGDDSDSGPVPLLPEKRKSYASTTSSRASSSVFSDTAPDFSSPLSPSLPSNFQRQFPERILGGSLGRDSRGSTMPSGSSSSTLSPTTPRPGPFTSPRSNTSGPNGYSYVTPPSTSTSPRVPYDYVSSPNASVASWVSESTHYFSAHSSFDSDILSPGSPPKRGFNTGVPPPSLSSTPRNVDLLAGTSPTKNDSTPPLIPFKGTQSFSTSVEKADSYSFSETTSVVTSSTKVESVDQPVKPRTPVPVPRRNTLNSSSGRPLGSSSRSQSEASDGWSNPGPGQEATPPPVKPRKSLHFPADQGPKSPPPPKPPRPSQAREPPPKPKPYASRSVESSPATQRKAANANTQNIAPSEENGS